MHKNLYFIRITPGYLNESEGELCLVQEKSADFSKERVKTATGHYCSATHMERRSFAAETPAGKGGKQGKAFSLTNRPRCAYNFTATSAFFSEEPRSKLRGIGSTKLTKTKQASGNVSRRD